MDRLSTIVTSTVGRKFLNGLTGFFLCLFITVHLLGNLLIVFNPEGFNVYAHTLESLGEILIAVEIGLVLVFLIHAITAVSVWWNKLSARPDKYRMVKSVGYPSRQTISSRTMIYTGIILGVFLVIHVIMFKYGPYYLTTHEGVQIRDLYKLVVEEFSKKWTVIAYEAVMILLGFHLRHGFWSAFQSLGMNHPKYSPIIYVLGIIFAIVIAVGFLAIPPYIYFTGGAS